MTWTANLTCRCRINMFANICKGIKSLLTNDDISFLKDLNFYSFLELPPLTYHTANLVEIIYFWEIESQSFTLGGREVRFCPDDIALLSGLPNHGLHLNYPKQPLAKYNSIDIKNKIQAYSPCAEEPKDALLTLFIQFLFTNLFFVYNNLKIPKSLLDLTLDLEKLKRYNWAHAIWALLSSQFDALKQKAMKKHPLGYISGFAPLLILWFFEHSSICKPIFPLKRPRMMKWHETIMFCSEDLKKLRSDDVFDHMQDIYEDELQLIESRDNLLALSIIADQQNTTQAADSPSTISPKNNSGRGQTPEPPPPSQPPSHPPPSSTSNTQIYIEELFLKHSIALFDLINKRFLELEQSLINKISFFEQKINERVAKIEFFCADKTLAKSFDLKDSSINKCDNINDEKVMINEEVNLMVEEDNNVLVDANNSQLIETITELVDPAIHLNEVTSQEQDITMQGFEVPDVLLDRVGHRKMKRSFPWEEVVTISVESSDSDFDEDKQDRAKRGKKDYSSENIKDFTSEGTLIRMAEMYQEYMKRISIPTFSSSVVPFTSWQGLAKSLKQLYGQPLHYLTNSLLKQWDRERFGSDNEHQPLDAIVHPVKAQTLIWLTEELHRLTASPFHLAKLWASDPMYHSRIDPFLSC